MTIDPPAVKAVTEQPNTKATPPQPEANRLLCELPSDVKHRINPHLELVELKLGQVIGEAGSKMRYVYFPIDSIISLLYVMEMALRQKSL